MNFETENEQITLRATRTAHGVFGPVTKGDTIELFDRDKKKIYCHVIKTDGSKTLREVHARLTARTTARTLACECVEKGPYELVSGDLEGTGTAPVHW